MSIRSLSELEKRIIVTHLNSRRDKSVLCAVVLRIIEKKGKKKPAGENALVVGKHRLYLFRTGSAAKVVADFHILDLLSVSSPSVKEVEFKLRGIEKPLACESAGTKEIIQSLLNTYHEHFPSADESQRFQLHLWPRERISEFTIEKPVDVSDSTDCGAFSKTYKSVCNYMGVNWRVDIAWDMHHILGPAGVKEFNLKEFNFEGMYDFKPCVATLRYNTWFTSLIHKGKLPKEVITCLAEVMRYNGALQSIALTHVPGQSLGPVVEAICFNKRCAITSIDFSQSILEDKGLSQLAKWLREYTRGMISIDLSGLGATQRAMMMLFDALEKNTVHHSTLTRLSLSGNKLDGNDPSYALGQALRQFVKLKYLNLSAMSGSVKLEPVVTALKRTNCITQLDLSGMKLNLSKKSLQYIDLIGFVSNCSTLRELNLARTTVSAESLIDVIINSLNVAKIDLSENDLKDKGIMQVADKIPSKKSLKHVLLDRNFNPGRSKYREKAVASLINLINSPDSQVQALSISGGPGAKYGIRADLLPFIQAIGTAEKLTELDISGHVIQDLGVIYLGKSIQQNKSLTTLRFDENGTTMLGFQAFSKGLERNPRLVDVPLPVLDIAAWLASESQRTPANTAILEHIQQKLLQNAGGQKKKSVPQPTQLLTPQQKQEMRKLLHKIETLMEGTPTGRQLKDEEMDEQIRYLVGEEFLASLGTSVETTTNKLIYDKLYEQLEAIIVLSSIDDSKPNNNQNNGGGGGAAVRSPSNRPPAYSSVPPPQYGTMPAQYGTVAPVPSPSSTPSTSPTANSSASTPSTSASTSPNSSFLTSVPPGYTPPPPSAYTATPVFPSAPPATLTSSPPPKEDKFVDDRQRNMDAKLKKFLKHVPSTSSVAAAAAAAAAASTSSTTATTTSPGSNARNPVNSAPSAANLRPTASASSLPPPTTSTSSGSPLNVSAEKDLKKKENNNINNNNNNNTNQNNDNKQDSPQGSDDSSDDELAVTPPPKERSKDSDNEDDPPRYVPPAFLAKQTSSFFSFGDTIPEPSGEPPSETIPGGSSLSALALLDPDEIDDDEDD